MSAPDKINSSLVLRKIIVIFSVCCLSCEVNSPTITSKASTLFQGDRGVYALSTADKPQLQQIVDNPDIQGLAIRTKWESLETAPDVFDWDFLDEEIERAEQAGKKVSITLLGNPSWLKDLGASYYEYVDENPYHDTYMQTLFDFVPWDDIYIERLKKLITNLSLKYKEEFTISYFNMIAVQLSRNLPENVAEGLFYEVYEYDADYLVTRMKEVLDHYMIKFPNTPLWSSMDYIVFEPEASGNPRNYVAAKYAEYGIANYPDRFGLWREDISGCNPDVSQIPTGSQWYIMYNNPCRIGAQMLWSVQDGPDRMNKCGLPNTKLNVLQAAIDNGLLLGMHYLEIYTADLIDPDLKSLYNSANSKLKNNDEQFCDL